MSSAPNFYRQYFPDTFTLDTPRVQLKLMRLSDLDAYLHAGTSTETWKYFTQELNTPESMQRWMEDAIADREGEKRVPFTVIDKESGKICGSTSYGNISWFDKRIEIGWSWLGKEGLGTGVNKHAKFALLSFAFEVLQMERVEIKTDNLNDRAKAALIKVGMIPEGILRSHMQMHSNRRRDTIYFSILRNEWQERRAIFFGDLI